MRLRKNETKNYVYCIHGDDSRTGLCGKENTLRYMYGHYNDTKNGLLSACPKCVKIGKKRAKVKK